MTWRIHTGDARAEEQMGFLLEVPQ